MPRSHAYDTVAFDVRDSTTMLFFATTSAEGEILDYLLIMRSVEENFEETLFIEVDEKQIDGKALLDEVGLIGNTLTLRFREPVEELGKLTELVLTFDETETNLSNMESGAFRVLGEYLKGGNA
jgi:hypothetical protein